MAVFILSVTALAASCLTFFSGFGLGTILTPAFSFFVPIDLAVAMTAVVHLLNDIFKLVLVGKYANKKVVFRFGIPAILSSFIGAWVLVRISDLSPIATYEIGDHAFQILPVKAVIGILLVGFALFEILPVFSRWQVSARYLPVGGILSGFFGGLSGNQGALRSVFLAKSGLTKESFVATGSVIACLIDVTRLTVYAKHFATSGFSVNSDLMIAATLSAFTGAYLGSRLLKKITMDTIHYFVGFALIFVGVALAAGLI